MKVIGNTKRWNESSARKLKGIEENDENRNKMIENKKREVKNKKRKE